jgi:quinol monooxygenase YgiN
VDKIHIKSNTFVSRFTIKPERRAEFLSIWEPLWRDHIDVMNAITHFVFYGWGRDGNELVAIESYKDEAQLAELRKTPKFQEIVGQLLDCCSKPMTMELFSGLETNRAVFDMYPKGPSKVHPAGKSGIGTVFL